MKIWMTSDGSYSDYHATGLFSTEEKAKRAKKVFGWENNPFEMVVDEISIPKISTYRVIRYVCTFSIEAFYCEKNYKLEIPLNQVNDQTTENRMKEKLIHFSLGSGYLEVYVQAEDTEHAKKIAINLFTQYEARKAGL